MIEKVIQLENIALIDFLGVENTNIKQLVTAFPKCKIVSRGHEIKVKGPTEEIVKLNDIFNALIAHYNKFGKVTEDNVQTYIHKEVKTPINDFNEDILIYGTKGMAIKPQSENQRKIVKAAFKNDLVFTLGPAGTGKTYIAVAMAVKALKNREIKKIIITRPAVEAGENLGFLPGDLKEKLDPYLRPIYDALHDMIPSEKLKYYLEDNIIEIAPLAYMRGRTLSNAFILLDEAQNTTTMQMKMFLTRMGKNSKMIINGDHKQIDLPRSQRSGLIEAANLLRGVKGISIIEMDGKDVVRHKLVKNIIAAYDKHYDKLKALKEAKDSLADK